MRLCRHPQHRQGEVTSRLRNSPRGHGIAQSLKHGEHVNTKTRRQKFHEITCRYWVPTAKAGCILGKGTRLTHAEPHWQNKVGIP